MSANNPVADQVTIRANKLSLVERLADDLAHEIKNPLHSMVINLEVLRRRIARLEAQPGEDLLRYARVLSSELERVNRRVDLLLRMVRPHRDSDDPTTIAEVMDELRELVELECERHEVTLEMEIPHAIVRARLPRAATRQMILSLILKTLDSLQPGGTLRVTSEMDRQWMRLHFQGIDRAPSGERHTVPDDSSYLPVARALAERLGGHMEVLKLSAVKGGEPCEAGHYVLALPREP